MTQERLRVIRRGVKNGGWELEHFKGNAKKYFGELLSYIDELEEEISNYKPM